MQTIALGNSGMRSSVLGFGCAAVMGRVGRKASLAALGAAYDGGITFFDTARSYGYGESEELLGEFLRGRRSSVLIATKFGILPAPASRLKRVLKPVARGVLQLAPSTRSAMQRQLAAQTTSGHFSVAALHASLHASLQALRTDYVDFLFLHEAPSSVLQQDDLFAALDQLVATGKIRCAGIAPSPEVAVAALAANLPGLHSVQLPCNFMHMDASKQAVTMQALATRTDIAIIGNHPFGGAAGVTTIKSRLRSLAAAPETPQPLREKLRAQDDALLADAVLNIIAHETSIQVVVPSMLRLDHLRANIAVIERSRFSNDELHWLRGAISAPETLKATQPA